MKESSIDKIFAKSPEEAKKMSEVIKERFRTQENISFKTEREKTKEELETIDFVDKETNKYVEKFGGNALNIPAKNIHILEQEEYIDSTDIARKQSKKKAQFKFRRAGLTIYLRGEKPKALAGLNEAVIEYLRRLMMEDWVRSPENLPKFIQEKIQNLHQKEIVDQFYNPAYLREQTLFMITMDKILEKNPDKFKSRDEVFDLFARGMFTGKILELRTVVDMTFGKGGFVKFAKESFSQSKSEKEKQGSDDLSVAISNLGQQAIVMSDHGKNLFDFIQRLAHEEFHMKEYQTMEQESD